MGILICMYDWLDEIDWRSEEAFCQEALSRLGIEAEYFAYHVRGARKSRRGRKSKLDKLLTEDIQYLGLFNFGGDEINFPQPKAIASVSSMSKSRKDFCLFSADHHLIGHRDLIVDFTRWLGDQKVGGVGFAKRHIELPEYFAGGSSTTLATPAEERDRTLLWFVGRRDGALPKYQLRDLFSINIITIDHLNFDVGGCTLHEWILSDPARGRIIGSKPMLLWTIEESNLDHLQKELEGTGLLAGR